MTDFVIVIATAVALAAPAPALSATGANAAASVPLNAPTVGFNVYRDPTSCEQAAERLAAPPGKRLVCLPVVPHERDLASPY